MDVGAPTSESTRSADILSGVYSLLHRPGRSIPAQVPRPNPLQGSSPDLAIYQENLSIYQFLHRPPKQVTQVLLLRLLPRLISFQRQAPSTATASPRHPALATPRKSRNMGNFEKKTQRLKRWNYVEFHAMSNFCVMTRTRAGELSTGSARPTRLT